MSPPRVCLAVARPVDLPTPERVHRTVDRLRSYMAALGWRVTLLTQGHPWGPLAGANQEQEADARDLPPRGLRAVAQSHRFYAWLKQREADFDAILFTDYGGAGFASLQAKRVGLRFQATPLVTVLTAEVMQELLDAELLPTSRQVLELAHLERCSRAWADVVLSPSAEWFDALLARGQALPTRRVALPFFDVTPLPLEPPRPAPELVVWGTWSGRAGHLIQAALGGLTRDGERQPAVTFVDTAPLSAALRWDESLRAIGAGRGWTFKRLADPASAVYYARARHATVVLLPGYGASLAAMDCLAAGVPVVAPTGALAAAWLEPTATPAGLPALSIDQVRRQLERALHGELVVPRVTLRGEATVALRRAALEQSIAATPPRAPALAQAPLISVCLTHHERPQQLQQALRSLRAQSSDRFEVILVDDGSRSPAAVACLDALQGEFAERGWTLTRQPNTYLGAARNHAARLARGDYLLFMDDDNVALPHEIASFAAAAAHCGADLLLCRLRAFTGDGPPAEDNLRPDAFTNLGAAGALAMLHNPFGDANALIRKAAFDAIGGFTEDYGVGYEDWELFNRMMLAGHRIEVIPEILYCYRVQAQSMLRMGSPSQDLYRGLRPFLERYPELRDTLLLLTGYSGLEPRNPSSARRLARRLGERVERWTHQRIVRWRRGLGER